MSTYGPNGANGVPFTGFSPTLGAGDAVVPVQSGNVQFNGLAQTDNRISALLRARGNRGMRRLLQTLVGVAPGATATETNARVSQTQPAYVAPRGGIVPIETNTTINRATTSADVANVVSAFTRSSNLVYPLDASGNGGGSKLASYGVGLLMVGGTIITVGGMGFSI